MNRIFSFFLTISLVLGILIVPVSASSTFSDDLPYIDVMQYGSCAESITNSQQMNERGFLTFTYSIPDRTVFTYVDILFNYNANASNFLVYLGNDALTCVNVSKGLFRAYGKVAANYRSSLAIDISDANAKTTWRVTMESIKIGFDDSYSVDTDAYADINAPSYGDTIHFVPGDTVNHRTWQGVSSLVNAAFGVHVYKSDWRPYDFLDFYMYVDVASITSIDVTMGGKQVPYQVTSFIDQYGDTNPYVYQVKVDLRGLDRSSSDYPMITISGVESKTSTNMVAVLSCVGSVYFQMTEPDVAWYQKIFNAITSGFDDLRNLLGADNDPDGFKEDVQDKTDELNDLSQSIGNVPEPDISNVNMNISGQISPQILTAANQGIGTLLSNQFILRLFILAITFALAGFILYGKK